MDPLPLGRCSEKTSSGKCSRWAIIICSHCDQGICSEHYEIHQHEVQLRVHRLNNEINDFRQILHTLTYEKLIENCQKNLDQWSEKCKKEIDIKHAKMSDELLKEIKQLNIDQFRTKRLNYIDQYIGQPLTDILRIPNNIQIKHLQLLEQQFLDSTSFIQIKNDGSLDFKDQSKKLFSQHTLKDCPGAMAGSSLHYDYLLIFQIKPYFSLVFIENNKHITRTSIDYFVYDICWSQSTQVFLIATEFYLYEFYPLNNRLSKPYGNCKSSRKLWSLACNLTDLYIIHKPDMIMYERDLKKPFEKKRKWLKNEIMCDKGDQIIGSIRIDEQKQILGLSIKQIDYRWRVDLFSLDNMQRLYRGSSFGLSTEINSGVCIITPLLNHENQWLVQHSIPEKQQTILLDEKGQVINEIDRSGYNITLISRDKIAFLNSFGLEIYQR